MFNFIKKIKEKRLAEAKAKREACFVIDGEFQEDELLQGEVCNYNIKYVHELQHIFRMLKLKKEIVL